MNAVLLIAKNYRGIARPGELIKISSWPDLGLKKIRPVLVSNILRQVIRQSSSSITVNNAFQLPS